MKDFDNNRLFKGIYSSQKGVFDTHFPEYVSQMRHSAVETFEKMGLPLKRAEQYKYTNIEQLFNKEYSTITNDKNISLDIEDVFQCDVPRIIADNLLIVNGFYSKFNTVNGWQESGIWAGSLQKAFVEIPQIMQTHFGKYITIQDGLSALNQGLFTDGFVLYVPKNKSAQKPIQVINVQVSHENSILNTRNLIVIEDEGKADVIFCEHTLSKSEFLTNSLTEVYVGKKSVYNHVTLQNENDGSAHITSTFIYQESESKVSTNTLSLHGGTIRNNFIVTLDGEGADHNSYGLSITDISQHVDNNVFVNHAKPNCTSNQLYKSILDNDSTGAFTGRILVSRDAQKTKAYQRNSSLLLNDSARMNSRPQLEIYADDVKCSHGATVGQLDQDALFYMRARGIPFEEARQLLMFAFAHEIIGQIPEPAIQERIDHMVSKRLRGELARCNNCQAKNL